MSDMKEMLADNLFVFLPLILLVSFGALHYGSIAWQRVLWVESPALPVLGRGYRFMIYALWLLSLRSLSFVF